MQKVRNAAAHWNNETFADIKNLRPYYISSPIRHPSEAIFWIDPTTNDYAFFSWIEELRVLADVATD